MQAIGLWLSGQIYWKSKATSCPETSDSPMEHELKSDFRDNAPSTTKEKKAPDRSRQEGVDAPSVGHEPMACSPPFHRTTDSLMFGHTQIMTPTVFSRNTICT